MCTIHIHVAMIEECSFYVRMYVRRNERSIEREWTSVIPNHSLPVKTVDFSNVGREWGYIQYRLDASYNS